MRGSGDEDTATPEGDVRPCCGESLPVGGSAPREPLNLVPTSLLLFPHHLPKMTQSDTWVTGTVSTQLSFSHSKQS